MWWYPVGGVYLATNHFEKLRFHWLFGFKEELFVRRDG